METFEKLVKTSAPSLSWTPTVFADVSGVYGSHWTTVVNPRRPNLLYNSTSPTKDILNPWAAIQNFPHYVCYLFLHILLPKLIYFTYVNWTLTPYKTLKSQILCMYVYVNKYKTKQAER